MSLQQFIEKYLGTKVDWDKYYGGQCVDLYRQYVHDVLDFPQSPGVGGASEIWDSASPPQLYDFIENTPTGLPQAGDIVVWNRKVGGGFGHVAIFLSGDLNKFVSLDQNWPTLSKVTKTTHNYNSVIGWMRPKLPTIENPMPNELQKVLDHYKVKTSDELITMIDAQLGFLESERGKNKELTDKLSTCKADLKTETGVSNDRKKELEEIAYLLGTEVTVETARRNVEEIISRESGYIQQVAKLEKAVEERDNKIIAQKLKQETELDRLQEKIVQMEKKHALELDRLKEQVNNVQQQVGDTNEKEAENNVFKKLLDKIKAFILKY